MREYEFKSTKKPQFVLLAWTDGIARPENLEKTSEVSHTHQGYIYEDLCYLCKI